MRDDLTKEQRKTYPIATGVLDYFPDAIEAIAHVSWVGNEQHNPGTHLHWDRSKSGDESDAMMRHYMEKGKLDTDGQRHSAKMAWRALAFLQKEIEQDRANLVQAGKDRTDVMNAIFMEEEQEQRERDQRRLARLVL